MYYCCDEKRKRGSLLYIEMHGEMNVLHVINITFPIGHLLMSPLKANACLNTKKNDEDTCMQNQKMTTKNLK